MSANPREFRDALHALGRALGSEQMLTLRNNLLKLSTASDADLSRAGTMWCAALGAAISMLETGDEQELAVFAEKIQSCYDAGARAFAASAARNVETHVKARGHNTLGVRSGAPLLDPREARLDGEVVSVLREATRAQTPSARLKLLKRGRDALERFQSEQGDCR